MVSGIDFDDMLSHYDVCDTEHSRFRWEALEQARRHQPLPRTDAYGGYYIVTRYADVRFVLENPELFSSNSPATTENPVRLPPLDADPPRHAGFRRILNPLLSRKALQRFEPAVRKIASDAINVWVDDGRCEFMSQFAVPYTAGVLSRIVFDEANAERVSRAVELVTQVAVAQTPEAFFGLAVLAGEYLDERAATGGSSPPGEDEEDILTALANATIDGQPLSKADQLGMVTVLFLGGLDTTRGATGNIVSLLAQDPSLEPRLRDPRWTRAHLDEFLRYQSPVLTMCRTVTADVDLAGRHLNAGDRLMVHFGSANRDESQFACPAKLDLDAPSRGNAAFGLGIHRCVGSHLARFELEIAFDELFKRVKNLRLPEAYEVSYAPGVIHGPAELQMVFDRV